MSHLATIAEAAFNPVARAIAAHCIPGATLGVITADGERALVSTGSAQLEPRREALTLGHWFDLASLTKVIATTPTILRLVDDGRIALDQPLADVIPDLRQYDVAGAIERRVTFRQCLSHQTHFPAVEPIYTYGDDPRRLRAFILQREWRAGPPVYSDINFILLGIAIERLTRRPLDKICFPPGLAWRPDAALSVATERCMWRERVLKGEVHDENASALGGAAGHAGLFGTIDGVLDFALGLLDGSGASEAALMAMRERASPTRTCGWERHFPGWPGGDACSDMTIGHTGFTGTGLWLDFQRGLGWALLTNRVHPTRHADSGIAALRRATGNAVVRAFDAR
ncbi:serine hydrolase domain-containing protein [Sphingomonas sp.]|uniref:serine hydrolase domain-containing protein n=1 Tax=Sphingomonas sp. TaxID=28214 RepID=UPI002CFA2F29|nr:serine hydrolase domain-containing protein [Sphingomonas sp.]HTG37270.1 serine hydrolase domain-containing protein [Sphingomonas sp.]